MQLVCLREVMCAKCYYYYYYCYCYYDYYYYYCYYYCDYRILKESDAF